jgi:hypothetical protein
MKQYAIYKTVTLRYWRCQWIQITDQMSSESYLCNEDLWGDFLTNAENPT